MAGAWFVVGLMVFILFTAGAAYYVKVVMPRQLRARRVKRLAPQPTVSYDKPALRLGKEVDRFPLPALETEAEAETKPVAETAPLPAGTLVLTEKDLQARIDAAVERGRIEAFGRLWARGYAKFGRGELTAAKELVFGTSGRTQTRIKPLIEAEVDRWRLPAPTEQTPIGERDVPSGVQYQPLPE